ncbi:MAG: hypothetical protein Q4C71_06020, partial [Microbacteriaceae bacterium]|nr:hypothetical protein [Microbacteriaceae bacterium]
ENWQNQAANQPFPAPVRSQYYVLNNPATRPQNLPQYIPGTGALSKTEEKLDEVHRFETLRENGSLVPAARPDRDERGRKMSPSYQPRQGLTVQTICFFICGVWFIGFTLVGGIAIKGDWNTMCLVIGSFLSVAFVIYMLLELAGLRRAIAYDERHGAAARFMPPAPTGLEQLKTIPLPTP